MKKVIVLLFSMLIIVYSRSKIMADEKVYREKLPNGVTVIIDESHEAHVVACNFWVKVGSSWENDSQKGISHFIEHLMFKGTKKRKVGDIDKEIKELGGYNNAFTSYDNTNYVIVLPAEYVDKAIDIEYDALSASVFDQEEMNKEREVVIDELKRGMDNPGVCLWQKLMESAFDNYYKIPIIGYEDIVRKVTRDDVVNYYGSHYTAPNLVVVISGDVNRDKVLNYVKSTFGTLPSVENKTEEKLKDIAAKDQFKYTTFNGQIESAYLAIGFNIPDAVSEDIPKLEVLGRILGGTESSILYQSLKEDQGLVDSIDSELFSGKLAGLFVISANLRKGKYADVMKNIFLEIDRLKKEGIKNEDLEKVKEDILREEAKENMKVENMAGNLGYFETLGDYNMYYKYYNDLKRVTAEDVMEVLNKYIKPEAAKITLYYPQKEEAQYKKYVTAESIAPLLAVKYTQKEEAEGKVTKTVLKNGITLIHKKLTNTPIVAIKFIFKGGVIYEKEDSNGVTNLMTETMFKGTTTRDAKEIAKEIDELGLVINGEVQKDSFGWSAEFLNDNFDKFMNLFSDIVLNPSFELPEIKKEKEDIINSIKKIKDSPAAYADKLFNKLLFEWHPYSNSIMGEIPALENTVSSKMIKAWHKRFINPDNVIVVAIGNIDRDDVEAALDKYFGKWPHGQNMQFKLPTKVTNTRKFEKEKIDKNQTHIILGFLGPKTNSRDYFVFRVLDTILSGGMNSRLFTEVRDKRNLCYTIFSTFDRSVENGAFKIYTATSPENEDKVKVEILKVLKDLYNKGVTDYEMKVAKAYINGMFKIGTQDYMAQADSYGMYEFWGLGYKEVDKFLDDIYSVTKKEVNSAIKDYFKLENYCEVVVGPDKNTAIKDAGEEPKEQPMQGGGMGVQQ